MNSRLLHAAARGARIESLAYGGDWFETNVFVQGQDERIVQYRIHPSDEHLAYGPVSTELREFALNLEAEDNILGCVSHAGLFKVDWNYYDISLFEVAKLETRVTFLLILAEALADEGI